jgi:hypothetical protein
MKLLTFAAGLAAGYVLGTRAGRERFQQLTDEARKLSNHPKVAEWQDKAKHLLASGTQAPSSATNRADQPYQANQVGQASPGALPSEPGPDATTVAESVAQPRPRRPRAATPGTITESPA